MLGNEASIMKRRNWITFLALAMSLVTLTASLPGQSQFVYAAGSLYGYSVNLSTGALTMIPGLPSEPGSYESSLATDATGKFLYLICCAPDCGPFACGPQSNVIKAYSIDPASGALTAVAGSPFAANFPTSIAVDATGKFAYVGEGVEFSPGGQISAYSIDPNTGGLAFLQQLDGESIGSVAVDPGGKFVYGASAPSNTIFGYAIDPNAGTLTAVPGSPFLAGGVEPLSVATHPSGRFVYAANAAGYNFTTGNLAAFAIYPDTGALAPVPVSPFGAGAQPYRVAADPSGRFVYLTNASGSPAISAYRVDLSTGSLVPIAEADVAPVILGGVPVPALLGGVTVDCTGRFLYATWLYEPFISGFSIDSETGVLTQVPGSPFPAQVSGSNSMTAACTSAATRIVSRVTAPTAVNTSSFQVRWSGTDVGGPGIQDYTIYVSDSGGPYDAWLTQTTLVQATFTGAFGHTYSFYSIARDLAGNLEPAKTAAEATTVVDNTKPVSHVSPLPATEPSTNFVVQWSGTDTGSGVREYTIYVSDNGGAFTPWQAQTAATNAWYSGFLGHTYGFFSQAQDNAGNVESLKSAPEARTQTPAQSTEDVNGDGQINCTDVDLVKASFGKKTGQTGFNPAADVNKDGVVNILDLSLVTQKLIPGTACR